jgi:hypothetical protein
MEEIKISKITTIKLEKETKARIDKFRVYRRETYDEILQKLLEILNLCRASPERARARLISIDRQKKRPSRQSRELREIKIQKRQL